MVESGKASFGFWTGLPARSNIADLRHPFVYPLPRILERFRLKEWRSLAAADGRWSIRCLVFDAKLFGIALLDIHDRATGRRYGFRRFIAGHPFRQHADSLYPSRLRFRRFRTGMELGMDPAAGTASLIAFTVPVSGISITCRLAFDLREGSCAPATSCAPLGLQRAALISRVFAPVSGQLVLGDELIELDQTACRGLVEDGKAFLPLHSESTSVTGFGLLPDGRHAGFALTDLGAESPLRPMGNTLFIGTRAHGLPPVRITQPYGEKSPWNIQDMEGMVDLSYTPVSAKGFELHAGGLALALKSSAGTFEGTLNTPSGESVELVKLPGLADSRLIRL